MHSERNIDDSAMKKALIVFLTIIISICVLLIGLFGLFYYDRVYGTSCASMSEKEAVQMIDRILDEKASKVPDDIILFESKRSTLEAMSVKKSIGVKATETEFKIQFIDGVSNNREFIAYIYASCEVQWVKSTNA